MSQHLSQSSSGLQQVPDLPPFSLEALLNFGQAALDPGEDPLLRHITWRRVEGQCNNAYNATFAFGSNDLFKSSTGHVGINSICSGSKLSAIFLDFLYADRDRPHQVGFYPSGSIQAAHPADLPRIIAWLNRSRLRLQGGLAGTAALLLLAIATLVMAAWPDAGPDDDDPSHDHTSLRA